MKTLPYQSREKMQIVTKSRAIAQFALSFLDFGDAFCNFNLVRDVILQEQDDASFSSRSAASTFFY